MTMRGGDRGGRRRDPENKAVDAGVQPAKPDSPDTLSALTDLVRLIGRSNAPQLRVRLVVSILLLFPKPAKGWGGSGLWNLVGFYAISKIFESADSQIFHSLAWVSGHTLKHLFAAGGIGALLFELCKDARKTIGGQ